MNTKSKKCGAAKVIFIATAQVPLKSRWAEQFDSK